MATRTRNTTTATATSNDNASKASRKGKGKAAPTVQATPSTPAPAPVVAAPAAPCPVVVSTAKVPARGRSYTYPALRGKVTAAVVLDGMLSGGATLADMAAALVHYMPDNYSAHPANAVNKAKAHMSFLRKHGAVIAETGGVYHCPDARAIQTMARGGN
jgi:hypothetical protein